MYTFVELGKPVGTIADSLSKLTWSVRKEKTPMIWKNLSFLFPRPFICEEVLLANYDRVSLTEANYFIVYLSFNLKAIKRQNVCIQCWSAINLSELRSSSKVAFLETSQESVISSYLRLLGSLLPRFVLDRERYLILLRI